MTGHPDTAISQPRLRAPQQVMRLERLGVFHQSRLSFMRQLLRRLKRENWIFTRPKWNINDGGVGYAVYTASGPERCYSLVAFSHDLDPALRSDRVIATAWDATFTLYDGVPQESDIKRLANNVPKQEQGRVSATELTLARANRSVRLFEFVVDALACGRQPDIHTIDQIGYLMRTTAVYGSGKFGAADREAVCRRPELAAPFQAEMLTVYLIRLFTLDLVEHLAQARSPGKAAQLAPEVRHHIGVGNSTGLGMAPFLVRHSALLNNWILARENALLRVRSVRQASPSEQQVFLDVLRRAAGDIGAWTSEHPLQQTRIDALNRDIGLLMTKAGNGFAAIQPWDALYCWAEQHLCTQAQELLVSLVLEPYGYLVDDLCDTMSVDEARTFVINGAMPVSGLKQLLLENYSWVGNFDFSAHSDKELFWYVSAEKMEPRLGHRFSESGSELEFPLAVARDVAALQQALADVPGDTRVASFLLAFPEHRHTVRRVQCAKEYPYSEIRDNLIGHDLLPIDLLRCKLSFFGAKHFDPRSDRWVRISMFQGAPFPAELAAMPADDWPYFDFHAEVAHEIITE